MDSADLPIPDYDEQSLGTLGHRIRSLTAQDVETLVHHERAHGNRTPVLEVLTARLDELRSGAEPSPGGDEEPDDAPGASRGGSPVSPHGAAEPTSPLRHGVAGPTPERGRPS
jgi:hypothetical protein